MPYHFLSENAGALSAMCDFISTYYNRPLSISLFKTKKSGIKLLLWGTTAETEQTRVNKIKAPNTKQGCKTNTLVMVYLQSLCGVEAELGVATLAIPSRSRIPNELLWETNY